MTADAFERLLYTDCRPGTGRGSGGGFQVQAQSPGVDSVQSALAVGWLLYEVQNAWIVQRRPVEDFPLGLAHAREDGYGTSQSRYLGKEATGGRQGNHLADCLLTRDPALYDTIRPAQLWRSSLWRAEPWDTVDCPPYEGTPEPGPLTLDAVTDWLRGRPERGPVLTRLLSVLENPDGPRVVIVTGDADEAMTWIAAATLLLPERRALDVSFKVFSASPLRAQQRVVAAPADLNPQLGPGRAGGLFVLDTATCTADEAENSERAAFLVGKLTGDDDPYDVVDAVELAEELGGGTRPADTDALRTAWALTRPDDPLPEPQILFRWLTGATPEQRREHGPAVAAMLLDTAPAAGVLRWLDTAAGSGELDLDPATVRIMLLDAELAEVLGGQAAPPEVLRPTPIGDQAERDAESKLSSAILLSSEGKLDAKQIDLVLRLTHRHDISLELSPPLQRQLHKFAVIWTDHPAAWNPRGWALSDEILDLTYGELREQVAERGPQAMIETLRGFCPYFGDRIEEPDNPLYCHLQAAAIARLAGTQRQARLRALFARIRELRQPGRSSPRAAAAAEVLQQALLRMGAVDEAVAITILAELPATDLDPRVAKYATDYLDEKAKHPDASLLDVLAGLNQLKKVPLPERLAALMASDRTVHQFIEDAASDKITKARYADDTARLLCHADPAVVLIRANEIVDALVTTQNRDLAGRVLANFPRGRGQRGQPGPVSTLIELVGDRLGGIKSLDEAVEAGLWCIQILAYPDFAAKQRRRHDMLSAILRRFDGTLSAENSERWRAEVTRQLKPEWQTEWDALFAHEAPRQGGIKQGISLWRTRS
jgi:hypothetical protein